jgi:type II secretory pathway pseudopilin PulG
MKKSAHRSSDGFSLVELLVTTLLIGGCAAGMAAAYGSRRGVADEHACAATRHNVAGAMEAYNLTHNTRRTDLGGLLPVLVREGFLTGLPADPGAPDPASWRQFTFDGRDVVCATHRGVTGPAGIEVAWPALGLPLLAVLYAIRRYTRGRRGARRVRIAVPAPADAAGTPAAGATSDGVAGPAPAPADPPPAPVPCHFCHALIVEVPLVEDGRPFHEECGAFYREKLL